jgi:hypothetical protein
MIFVENYNRRLAIPNEDGIIDKEIHCLLRQPFDVTCLADVVSNIIDSLYIWMLYNRHNLCLFRLHCIDNN